MNWCSQTAYAPCNCHEVKAGRTVGPWVEWDNMQAVVLQMPQPAAIISQPLGMRTGQAVIQIRGQEPAILFSKAVGAFMRGKRRR